MLVGNKVDQERVVELPAVIVVGEAVKVEIVGSGAVTVTVTVLVAVPPEFVAVRV